MMKNSEFRHRWENKRRERKRREKVKAITDKIPFTSSILNGMNPK